VGKKHKKRCYCGGLLKEIKGVWVCQLCGECYHSLDDLPLN
jgi:hypothetical protein